MTSEVAQRDEHERRRIGPFTFAKEVRAEARKVTWSTRQETMIYTIFVLVLVILAAGFFFLTDTVIRFLVALVLKLAS